MDFAVKKYRTLFISDVHLGTKVSQSQNLHKYLATVEVEKLYLLGDFADISNMRRHFFWDKHHNALIRHIFKMVKHGVEVVYIPGNHDKEIRDFAGMAADSRTLPGPCRNPDAFRLGTIRFHSPARRVAFKARRGNRAETS